MTVRDTILRFLIQSTGDKNLQGIVKEILELGTSAQESEKKVAGLLDEISSANKLQGSLQQYSELRKKILELQKQYTEARSQVTALGKAISETEKPTKKQVKEFESARTALKKLGDQVEGHKSRYRALGSELEKAGISTKRLSTASSQLETRAAGATSRINDLAESLRRAKTQAEGFRLGDEQFRRMARSTQISSQALAAYRERTRQAAQGNQELNRSTGVLSDSVSRLRFLFGGLATALSVQGLARGVSGMLGFADSIERTSLAFSSLYGGALQSKIAMDGLHNIARKNALSFTDVLAAARRLKAFGLEPLDGTLQALIDQNALLGGTQESLMGIILAVGQSWTKQKLQGEEVLQMAERGVSVWDRLARATGKSVPELQKLATQGKLTRKEIKLLIEQIGKETGGAAAKNIDLLSSRFVALKDRVQQFFLSVADSGSLQYFKDELRKVVEAIDDMIEDGRFQQYAKQLSDVIVGVAKAVSGTIKFINDYKQALYGLALAYGAVKVAGFLQTLVRVRAELALTAAATRGLGTAALAQTAAGGGLHKLTRMLLGIPRLLKFTVIGAGIELIIWELQTISKALDQASKESIQLEIANAKAASAAAILNFKITQTKQLYAEAAKSATLSMNEVQTATRNQLEQYELNLNGAIKYYRAISVEARRAGDAQSFYEAQQQLKNLPVLLQAVQDQLVKVKEEAEKTASRFGEISVKATQAFDDIIAKGQSTKQAVEGIFKDIDLTDAKGLKEAVGVMEQVSARGKEAAKSITKELQEQLVKLSTEDFVAFQEASTKAFAAGTEGAKALAEATESINLQRLGLDIEEVKTGLSSAAKSSIDAFAAAGDEVDKLGLTVEQKSRAMAMAFDAAFKNTNSKAELQALAAALQQAMAAGDISFRDFQVRVEQIKQKLVELGTEGQAIGPKVAEGANVASQSLGQLEQSADDAAQAVAGAGDSSLDAANKMNQASAQSQSFTLTLEKINDAAAKAYSSMNKYAGTPFWAKGINSITQEVRRQADSLRSLNDELDRQLAQNDPTAQKMDELRAQYGYLHDDTLRNIAQKQAQLQEKTDSARKEQEEATAAQRKEAEAASAQVVAALEAKKAQREAARTLKTIPLDIPEPEEVTQDVTTNVTQVQKNEEGILGKYVIEVVQGTSSKSMGEQVQDVARNLVPAILRQIEISRRGTGR